MASLAAALSNAEGRTNCRLSAPVSPVLRRCCGCIGPCRRYNELKDADSLQSILSSARTGRS